MNDSADQLSDLFPLPLTSMERFHWFDRNPRFTNHIYGRLVFKGSVDEELANQAARYAYARHPLLFCRIVKRGGQLAWDWDPSLMDDFRLNGKRDDDDSAGVPCLKIHCHCDGEFTTFMFEVSHSICDGLAAIQGIVEVLQTYHELVTKGESAVKLRKLNNDSLMARDVLGLKQYSYLKHLWKQPLGLYGAAKFIGRKPMELFSNSDSIENWNSETQPLIQGIWLDLEASQRLKEKANSMNVSANTIFFGELMKTLDSFRDRYAESKSPWVRVLLPMSVRKFADRRMSACNRTTIVQVDRKASDFTSSNFYDSLDREIKIIREWELSKLFLLSVRGMSLVPGMLQKAASTDKCRGTAVFANLAEPLRQLRVPSRQSEDVKELEVGNLRLVDLDFVGPIRHRMPLNVSVQKHFGRYRISMHFDPRIIPEDVRKEILSAYEKSLLSLASA